jgi:hypothetical protein
MIDFRYHLVSIIAVFLALAIGIVVGTTALNGYVVDDLRARNGAVIQDKRSLEASVRDLRNQVSRREQFAAAVGPGVVSGQLTGERVLLVTTPGASDQVVKTLTDLVTKAGGTATGQLRLHGDFLDPAKAAVVDDLTAQVAPPGLALPETAGERAALELAASVVTAAGSAAVASDAATKVLSGFASADLLEVRQPGGAKSAAALTPASLAIVVTGGSDGRALDDIGRQRQQAVLALLRTLDARSSGAVVVGPESAAGTGGLLEAVRRDGSLTDGVSSVDSVDTSYGAVTAILALHEQMLGRAGRYGQGPGSQAAAPPPASS